METIAQDLASGKAIIANAGRHIIKNGVRLIPYVPPTLQELRDRRREEAIRRAKQRKATVGLVNALNVAAYGHWWGRYHHLWSVHNPDIFDGKGRYFVMACGLFATPKDHGPEIHSTPIAINGKYPNFFTGI